MKSNISFILFSYNEEKRIAYAIKNFINYGRVFILDGGSTDKTKEIAEGLGATFFTRPETKKANVESTENFEFIKSIIDTDWIYWGYVDNTAPKPLVEKMTEVSKQNTIKMIKIPLYTYLWGNTENYAHKSDGPFLFHKDYVSFDNNHIHGLGKFLGTDKEWLRLEEKEDYALKHFSTYVGSKFVMGHLKYGEAEAREKFARGTKFSITLMLLAMIRYMYIYGKHSYKNGKLGLIIILHYAFFRLMTYTKLYELENGITLEGVEENYRKEKEKILEGF